MKERFVIIDGNAIIHRAYHALPPLTAQDGTMVNAVYGFTSMLLKILNDLKPEYIAVSFDVSGPTFRDALYKEYKATRVKAEQTLYDQIPLVHEVVRAFGIPIFTKEGFEADDVIGTLAAELRILNSELRTIIVTGDRDFLQLVDDDAIEVYLLKKGMSDFELYNEQKVKERFGFGPEHIVDYKSLRGDASDNIPGVPGIGEKTATELIQKFGRIEDIYEKIQNAEFRMQNEIKPNVVKKLEEGEESGKMSKELATIRRDVGGLEITLEKCKTPALSQERLLPLFQKLSFPSLLRRIPGDKEQGTKNKEQGTRSKEQGTKNKEQGTRSKEQGARSKEHEIHRNRQAKIKLEMVDSASLDSFLLEMGQETQFACKEVVSGTDILTGRLEGFVFAAPKKRWYVSVKAAGVRKRDMFALFSNASATLVGHDVKQLVKALQLERVDVKNRLFDIMIASYLLNSSTRAHDLPSLVLRELGRALPRSSDQTSLFGASPEVAAEELAYVLEIQKKFSTALQSRSDAGLFEKIEMALIPILAEMELHGVFADRAMLGILQKDIAAAIEKVTKKIWKEAGMEFNIASSVQLREVLFEKMGLPLEGIKKGKTGFSTAASELEKLRELSPIIPMIEEHRELSKLQNTYVDVLPDLINKKTGRIHTSFNQAVAATGRLSSSDPNLQNIPIRTELGKEIRNAFAAEPGNILVSADYSQIELRIVASLAKDERMIEIFRRGEDIHRATAAAINGVPLEEVTKSMRSAAKEVNFGVLYGMGAYGLSWRAGISQHEAKAFIEKYFHEFSGVKKYIDETLAFAKETGYVETLFGRRRYIPELASANFQLRSAGERMAINMPVQGTAADLMKLAMIAVHDKFIVHSSEFGGGKVKMILQVHDELVLEVKKGLEDEVGALVKKAMEGAAELRVPIEVLVHSAERWGDVK